MYYYVLPCPIIWWWWWWWWFKPCGGPSTPDKIPWYLTSKYISPTWLTFVWIMWSLLRIIRTTPVFFLVLSLLLRSSSGPFISSPGDRLGIRHGSCRIQLASSERFDILERCIPLPAAPTSFLWSLASMFFMILRRFPVRFKSHSTQGNDTSHQGASYSLM